MNYFYAHIVDTDNVRNELELLDMTDDEKNHLLMTVESSMHHVVINTLLTDLPEEHKQAFMTHLAQDDHANIWEVLKKAFEKPEEKIRDAAAKLKQEFINDIRELKAL